MKKGIFTIAAILISTFAAVPAVYAADGLPRVVDDAGLLPDDAETALSDTLDEISERQQADVVVVTVNSLDGATATEYADDFFDYSGYGFGDDRDGILFLISMEERDWSISTRGLCITAFTDAGQEYMVEQFRPDLSDGEYAAAFDTFAHLCDDYLTQAATGEPYDTDNLPKGEFPVIFMLLIDLAIGFVIALIATGIMRLKLKSVGSESTADNYVKKGSMHLTRETDLFLYRHIDRFEKPKEEDTSQTSGSTTHTSSSGATHGGSSGKF